MRIAQIAPLYVPVPPRNYGGTERVIANLTEALTQLGHDVTLFASGDSQTRAHLVSLVPKALGFDSLVDVNAWQIAQLDSVYRRADEFDVIHSHLDYLTLPFLNRTETPTVITLHGRLDRPEFERVFGAYPDANLISISDSQRAPLPHANWLATVHHSVDVQNFPYRADPGDYLVFVGRIAPEKGPDRAIAIAKQAGIPLKIAAKVDPQDRKYYQQMVRPLLDDPLIEYIGSVDEQKKRALMRNALALLAPIDWPEPFGMVFIEALACGTPVLTCPSGAAPEILQDGVTGYIRGSIEELAGAVRQVHTISRAGCRAYAERHFDIRRMALDYVHAYAKAQRRAAFFSAFPPGVAAHGVGDAQPDRPEQLDQLESSTPESLMIVARNADREILRPACEAPPLADALADAWSDEAQNTGESVRASDAAGRHGQREADAGTLPATP